MSLQVAMVYHFISQVYNNNNNYQNLTILIDYL